ncbi:hypothetical protein [Ornithinibacillus californiensis]|uniref:hypothetical protein n=1 Tax=Ornithinibacillus californiensis TaxID=161536 RepID=UPI00064D8144|nr:hypothetical protein [Ornithinibacillus californiensis]
MALEFLLLALGIAAAGYFLGEGLKNFKNPGAKSLLDSLDDDVEHELISAKEVHNFMGIEKEDAKSLIEEHPDIPHKVINGKVYYPKHSLREWLVNAGK